jgi:Uma2 family endonuclease
MKFSIYTGSMAITTAASLTIEDFARLPHDGAQHEVSEGELITLTPAKSLHSRIARLLYKRIEAALEEPGWAEAFVEAGYVLSREPLTIRQPDVSVISKERIQATGPDDYLEGAPELAVEIVSPSDSAEDLEAKVEQYRRAGAQQVWILFPKGKRVHVFSGKAVTVLDETGTLSGGDLLPGFSLKVSELFAQ